MIPSSRAGVRDAPGTLRRAPDVLFRRSGSATILARLHGTDFHSLDGPASLVWELLGEENSIGELASRMTDGYPALASWVEHQLRAVIGDLVSLGFVVGVDRE